MWPLSLTHVPHISASKGGPAKAEGIKKRVRREFNSYNMAATTSPCGPHWIPPRLGIFFSFTGPRAGGRPAHPRFAGRKRHDMTDETHIHLATSGRNRLSIQSESHRRLTSRAIQPCCWTGPHISYSLCTQPPLLFCCLQQQLNVTLSENLSPLGLPFSPPL